MERVPGGEWLNSFQAFCKRASVRMRGIASSMTHSTSHKQNPATLELALDEVKAWQAGGITVACQGGLRGCDPFGSGDQLVDGDGVNLGAEVAGGFELAVHKELTGHVVDRHGAVLRVGVNGQLQLVLCPLHLLRCEVAGETRQLGGHHVHERFGSGARDGGAGNTEEASVAEERGESLCRVDPVVPVEHVLEEPAVHALARPAHTEAGATTQDVLQHVGGHKVTVVPAGRLEGDTDVYEVLLATGNGGDSASVSRGGAGSGGARRDGAKVRVGVVDELGVVDATGCQDHAVAGVVAVDEIG